MHSLSDSQSIIIFLRKVLEHLRIYNPILKYGNRLHGKSITVINRSEVVGRPLAAMLANDGARVFSADINGVFEFHRGPGIQFKRHVVCEYFIDIGKVVETELKLDDILPLSDVVISGVPSEKFSVDIGKLKEGAVAINFSSFPNFKTEVKQKAALFVPSVGKVTVRMLQRNLLRLASAYSK